MKRGGHHTPDPLLPTVLFYYTAKLPFIIKVDHGGIVEWIETTISIRACVAILCVTIDEYCLVLSHTSLEVSLLTNTTFVGTHIATIGAYFAESA